jgi:hypothetical protein
MELVGLFISVLAVGDVLNMLVGALQGEPFQLTILPLYQFIAYLAVIVLIFSLVLYVRRGGTLRRKHAGRTSVQPEAEA